MNKALTATGISYGVKRRELLAPMDFFLPAGQITAVIGPNGAGKSTLIGTLAGDKPLASGSLSLFGRPLSDWQPLEMAQHLAVLPQKSGLNFPFTVRQVIEMGRMPYGDRALNQRVVDSVIQQLSLDALKGALYTMISGGEQQRTQLARVLAQIWPPDLSGQSSEPDASYQALLMLDEPMTGLDLQYQRQLLGLLKKLTAQGVSVLVALHDLNLAYQTADHLLVLDQGQLIAQGTPESVLTTALIERLYCVTPSFVKEPRTGRSVLVV